jgi:acetate kinase
VGSILVVNAGSTSLKLALVDEDEQAEAVESLDAVDESRVDAVGHRVVHGGSRFREPVVINAAVREAIFQLESLAPLHNAPALAGIEAAEQALPSVLHVAVFDTAFHATITNEAAVYAVPKRWRDEWGIRRYGFHGLSVQWVAEQVPVPRLVVCHLGGGCSVTAVADGRSVDTTMGFTPMEGVVMTTRSGSVDPGALIYVLREHGLTPDEVDYALNEESGLKALTGGSGDVRELEGDDERARLALAVYAHWIAAAVAAMAASLGGIDALAFTAGVGENSAVVREAVCERLQFLGVDLDAARNGAAEPDCEIAVDGSAVRIAVVRAREDIVAARAVRAVLERT